jgi:FO synthase subunit 1
MNTSSPHVDIDDTTLDRLLEVSPSDVEPADALSFARNVFVPLTTACRYTCTYCTFYDPPGEATLLSPETVREICAEGAEANCTEALFTLGDEPDERYARIHEQLAEWGHESIHSYLQEVCGIALEEGLLPHSNPGDQTAAQMRTIADQNVSMGVMLETTAEVQAHGGPRSKSPAQRIETIRTAGQLSVPFTTGILVGIGEGWRDRAESILTIRHLHEQYGHIQEVIVQPVVENERWRNGSPDLGELGRVVAMARFGLPDEISVQVPPNLSPVEKLLDCGVDDFGGVSPVTDDHINPDHAWPAVRNLEKIADAAGVPLRERLPVHRRYLPPALGGADTEDKWLDPPVLAAIRADDEAGERYRRLLTSD